MSIVMKTQEFVKAKLYGEGTGHDWWHIERVYSNCLLLMSETNEPVHTEVVELAALLHDIADWKFHNGDESVGPRVAREWLASQQVEEEIIQHVCTIIHDLSFKGAGTRSPMKSLEGMIVQDSDRLDAIGAIGIARAFAYGGYKGQELYNPLVAPKENQTAEAYKTQQTTTLNHFFEKLLLLKDRMNTPAARNIADERNQYMLEFVEIFLKESNAEETIHFKKLSQFA
jgi:uncharacterized protein